MTTIFIAVAVLITMVVADREARELEARYAREVA